MMVDEVSDMILKIALKPMAANSTAWARMRAPVLRSNLPSTSKDAYNFLCCQPVAPFKTARFPPGHQAEVRPWERSTSSWTIGDQQDEDKCRGRFKQRGARHPKRRHFPSSLLMGTRGAHGM